MGSTSVPKTPGEGSPRRMEALNDGVFTIVMTLIVLNVRVPEGSSAELAGHLLSVLPTLLTYALTFVTLGVLWFGNRTQSEFIERADHQLVWLNLLFLGVVALVPFSAALLGRYPTARLAVLIYGVHLTCASLAHGVCWVYATYHAEIMRPDVTERYRRLSRWAALSAALGYGISTCVGAIAPRAGLIGFILVPVPFVSGLYYRFLARIDRPLPEAPPAT